MIKKIIYTMLTFILWTFIPSITMAENQRDNFGWSYSIQDGIAKSKRTYMLVYDPQSQQTRQVTVISHCQKPYLTEGTYGKCIHDINIQSIKTSFQLDTGEDVVIVRNPWGSLILGTIGYGCCVEPDVIKFYTESGKYIGRLTTMTPLRLGRNVITDEVNLKNSAGLHESIKYFVVQDDEDDYKYTAWVKENKNEMVKLPILFSIPDKEKCDEWFMTDFQVDYKKPENTIMVIEGRFCEEQKRIFDCHKTENNITCSPIKQ